MALEKQIIVDKIEVTENGAIQVRTATRIVEDGTVISSSFHRHVIAPGQDYSGEDPRVIAICRATHTADCIIAFKAAQEAAQAQMAAQGA